MGGRGAGILGAGGWGICCWTTAGWVGAWTGAAGAAA